MLIPARAPEAAQAREVVDALQRRMVDAMQALAPGDAPLVATHWLRDGGAHGGGVRWATGDTGMFDRASVNVSQVHYDDLPERKLDLVIEIQRRTAAGDIRGQDEPGEDASRDMLKLGGLLALDRRIFRFELRSDVLGRQINQLNPSAAKRSFQRVGSDECRTFSVEIMDLPGWIGWQVPA